MEHFDRMQEHVAKLRLGDLQERQLADDFECLLERFDELTHEHAEAMVKNRKRRWHLQTLVGVDIG